MKQKIEMDYVQETTAWDALVKYAEALLADISETQGSLRNSYLNTFADVVDSLGAFSRGWNHRVEKIEELQALAEKYKTAFIA